MPMGDMLRSSPSRPISCDWQSAANRSIFMIVRQARPPCFEGQQRDTDPGNGVSAAPAISSDGQFVAFASSSDESRRTGGGQQI